MVDWRTTRGGLAQDSAERHWLHDTAAQIARRVQHPVIVHIGVEYGASLHCCAAGAWPAARIVGVDLDTGRCIEPDGFELIEGDSRDVAQEFHDKIDFLFIDGNHTCESVRADMIEWLGKVRPGGVVAFHDYNSDLTLHPWTLGVRQAVDAWHWAPTTWEAGGGAESIGAFWRRPFLRRGDSFGTVGFGCPYFKAQYEFFRWWSWLLVGGMEPGDQLLNSSRVRGEMPIPMAHNALVAEFLRTDRDTMLIVEDDHVGSQDVVRKMRKKEENWDFDIVCASYVNRRERTGGTVAVGFMLADDGQPNEYGEYSCQMRLLEVAESGTQEMDGGALGLVLIRRWVLDALRGDKEPGEVFWFDWRGRNSQDINFYGKVKPLGARVGVDRDNDIGHVGKRIYTMGDFYKGRTEFLKKQEVTQDG